MGLMQSEELVITSISKLGRQLSEGRNLQSGGVKIDFVIGVSDSARASITNSKVTQLASGSPALAMQFSQTLDANLQQRGQPPAQIPANSMAFSAPVQEQNAYRPAQTATQMYSNQGAAAMNQQQGSSSIVYQNQQSDTAETPQGSDNMLMGLVLGAFLMGIMGVIMFMYFSKQKAASAAQQEWHEEKPDLYASKVAAFDQNWEHDAEAMDQANW